MFSKSFHSFNNRAIDIWAIGSLVGEMLIGQPIFPGKSDIDQLYRITRCLGESRNEKVAFWLLAMLSCFRIAFELALYRNGTHERVINHPETAII